MTAIAERPMVQLLGLPPGSVPLEPVYDAIRDYRAGERSAAELIATIDRYGDELEAAIAADALELLAEFRADLQRLVSLHERLSTRLAQREWLARFPDVSEDAQPRALTIAGARGAEIRVLVLLDALARLELDEQIVVTGRPMLAARLERLIGEDGAADILALIPDRAAGLPEPGSTTGAMNETASSNGGSGP